jgi:NADH:ubiquinone oxidoreductase subunit E
MEKKYEVCVCTGTLCHVLGGAELPSLGHHLPESWKKMVTVKGSPCMKHCKEKQMQPPFVEVNGVLIEQASIAKVLDYLEKCMAYDSK